MVAVKWPQEKQVVCYHYRAGVAELVEQKGNLPGDSLVGHEWPDIKCPGRTRLLLLFVLARDAERRADDGMEAAAASSCGEVVFEVSFQV